MIDNLLHGNHTLTGTDNKILFEAEPFLLYQQKDLQNSDEKILYFKLKHTVIMLVDNPILINLY